MRCTRALTPQVSRRRPGAVILKKSSHQLYSTAFSQLSEVGPFKSMLRVEKPWHNTISLSFPAETLRSRESPFTRTAKFQLESSLSNFNIFRPHQLGKQDEEKSWPFLSAYKIVSWFWSFSLLDFAKTNKNHGHDPPSFTPV